MRLVGSPFLLAIPKARLGMKDFDSDLAGGDSLFRGLLESAPEAMVIVDKTGAIVLINSQTETLFGYLGEELLGRSVEVLVPQRFKSRHRSTYVAEPRPRVMGADLDLYGLKKNEDQFPVEDRRPAGVVARPWQIARET